MSLIYTSPTSRHNLYLGGKTDAKSLSTLQQRNIKRILNVTPSKEAGVVAGVPNYFENSSGGSSSGGRGRGGHTITYKRIAVYDASTTDMLPYAEEIVNFISDGLHHGSVLVHCQRGVSRSATAVIMFLIRKANMTFQQSLQLCQRRRSVVDPIPAFLDQLKEYEGECRSLGYLTAVDGVENKCASDDIRKSKNVIGRDVCYPSDNGGNNDGSGGREKRRKMGNDNHLRNSEKDEGEKRKVVGPSIGPSTGPSMPSMQLSPSMPEKKTIGPSMPPSIGPSKGPSMPEKKSIGPSMPASVGPSIDPSKPEKKAIGPAMPSSIGPSIGPGPKENS